jgi:hypothetical protein
VIQPPGDDGREVRQGITGSQAGQKEETLEDSDLHPTAPLKPQPALAIPVDEGHGIRHLRLGHLQKLYTYRDTTASQTLDVAHLDARPKPL